MLGNGNIAYNVLKTTNNPVGSKLPLNLRDEINFVREIFWSDVLLHPRHQRGTDGQVDNDDNRNDRRLRFTADDFQIFQWEAYPARHD